MFDVLTRDVGSLPIAALLAVLFGIAVLETSLVVGVVLPGEIMLASGIGMLPTAWTPVAGVLLAAGCFGGQLVGYLIGHRFGPTLRDGWVGRRTGPRVWAQAERVVHQSGGLLLVGSRFVAIAHTVVPVVAGALRMPIRRFTGYAALSSIVWAALWTVAGTVLGGISRAIDPGLLNTALVIAGVVIGTIVIGRVIRKPAEDEPEPRSAHEDIAKPAAC